MGQQLTNAHDCMFCAFTSFTSEFEKESDWNWIHLQSVTLTVTIELCTQAPKMFKLLLHINSISPSQAVALSFPGSECQSCPPVWNCETSNQHFGLTANNTARPARWGFFFLSADTFCNSTPAVWCRHVSVFWYDAGRRRLLLIFQRTREAPGYEMGAPQQLFGPSSIPRQGLVPASITVQTSTSPLNWLQVLRFHNKHSCISSMRSVGGWRDLYNSQFNANCFL